MVNITSLIEYVELCYQICDTTRADNTVLKVHVPIRAWTNNKHHFENDSTYLVFVIFLTPAPNLHHKHVNRDTTYFATAQRKSIFIVIWKSWFLITHMSKLFLAVHNSSIGDLVTESLTHSLTDLLILEHKTIHCLELMTSHWLEQDIWDVSDNFWKFYDNWQFVAIFENFQNLENLQIFGNFQIFGKCLNDWKIQIFKKKSHIIRQFFRF